MEYQSKAPGNEGKRGRREGLHYLRSNSTSDKKEAKKKIRVN